MRTMEEDAPTATAAAMLHDGAHAMRNDLATLRMAARLVEDPEVARSIDEAVGGLQVRVERAVVAARMELGAVPTTVTLDAAELVRIGTARAAREGTREAAVVVNVEAGTTLALPGPWGERLVADLLHGDAPPEWIERLARACGVVATRADGSVSIRQ